MLALALWRAESLFRDPLPPAVAAPARQPQTLIVPAPDRISARSTTLVRPLFSRSQNGDDTSAVRSSRATTEPASESTALPRLVGVVSDGERRLAIIAHNGVTLRIGENKNVGDWTVVRIEQRSALIRNRSKSEMLWLDPQRVKDADSIVESQ